MRNTVGVIAEYDPFHSAHAYQLSEAKRLSGAKYAAVAMSGSFTERGSVACFDKLTRARWALLGGADIVVELPVLFSLAPADSFARGGVALLSSLGVGSLSFGAENADAASLLRAASLIDGESEEERERFRERFRVHIGAGLAYPAALAKTCAELSRDGGECASLTPNNILALEYMRAAKKLSPDMAFFPVTRKGAAHGAEDASGEHASASAIRRMLERGELDEAASFLSEAELLDMRALITARKAPRTTAALSQAITAALLPLTREEIARLPYVGEGLENVIYSAVRSAPGYPEMLRLIKTKRYTEARLRRILLSALLGISRDTLRRFPSPLYIRVLGIRREALPILSEIAREATLPVVVSYADTKALSDEARAMLAYDLRAAELASLAAPANHPIENEFARKLIIV